MEIPTFLKKEIAGLPTWAWGGIIIAGGLLGFWFMRSNTTSNDLVSEGSATSSDKIQYVPVNVGSPIIQTGATIDQSPVNPNSTVNQNGSIVGNVTATITPKTTYTVQQNDWLSKIAPKFGISWQSIYNTNKDIIEATAKQYGQSSSRNGSLIYPGTVLEIPS